MTMRKKAILIILAVFSLYGSMEYAVQRWVVLPGFLALEKDEARVDVERSRGAIQRELFHLDTLCREWAHLRSFADPGDSSTDIAPPAFNTDMLERMGVEVASIFDERGGLLFSKVRDPETGAPIRLSGFSEGDLPEHHVLRALLERGESPPLEKLCGITVTERGFLLVSARPLGYGGKAQETARGVIVIGRFLDQKLMSTLTEQTRVSFRLITGQSQEESSAQKGSELLARMNEAEPVLRLRNSTAAEDSAVTVCEGDALTLVACSILPDIRGGPPVQIEVEIPRYISRQGIRTIQYALLTAALCSLVVISLMLWLLATMITKPLTDLTKKALVMGREQDFSSRFFLKRKDEIGMLAHEFDHLLDRLDEHGRELTKSNDLLLREIEERKKAEQAIQEQLHYLQSLIDVIPCPVFIIDRSGAYWGCNRAFAAYPGLESVRVSGKSVYDLYPKPVADRYHQMDMALFEQPGSQVFEARMTCVNGSKRDVIVNKATFRSHEGSIAGLVGVMLDITELKRAQEALSRQNEYLAALNETTLGLIRRLDLADLLEAIVVRAGALFGTPNGFVYLYDPSSGEMEMQVGLGAHRNNVGFRIRRGEGLAGKVWETEEPMVVSNYHEWEGRHSDARFDGLYWMAGVPLKSEAHVAGILGLSTYEIEKGFGEDEMSILGRFAELASIALYNARLYTQLSEELAERKRTEEELWLAKEAADAASRAKSEFLASVSHEIRTPMNAIMGMTRLTLDSELTPRQRRYQEVARSAAQNLLELLNGILDLSKIEAGKLELESTIFHLPVMLDILSHMFGQRASEKGVEWSVSIGESVPATLVGDPLRLRQVLINLLGNAVKFTDRGRIDISVERLDTPSDIDAVWLLFKVEDTGIGIAAKEVDRLFGPFTQADGSTTRKYGGTGLGLAISRRLVEMMGGEIDVESEPGVGSAFRFTARFELAEREYGSETERIAVEAASVELIRGARVLLVEDNFINQQVAMEVLNNAGVAVEIARNGREALEAVEEQSFDAVLMDIQMAEMDGFEATRIMRQNSRLQDLPIIAMTAHAMKGDREKCLDEGMNDYISKPVDTSELFSILARWIVRPGVQGIEGGGLSASEPGSQDGRQRSEYLPPWYDSGSDIDEAASELPGIDLRAALARVGGNMALYSKLLEALQRDYANTARDVRQDLSRGESQRALRQIHTLKGIAGNMAARRLHSIALEVESAITRGESNDLPLLLDELDTALEQVVQSARKGLQNMGLAGRSESEAEGREVSDRLEPQSIKASKDVACGSATQADQSRIDEGAVEGHAVKARVADRTDRSELEANGSEAGDLTARQAWEGAPGGAAEEPRASLARRLAELYELLRDNDLEAVECFLRIRKEIARPDLREPMLRFDQQIDCYYFDDALETLGTIADILGIPREWEE